MIENILYFYNLVSSIFLFLLHVKGDMLEDESPKALLRATMRVVGFGFSYSLISIFEPVMNIWVEVIFSIPLLIMTVVIGLYLLLYCEL